MSALSPVKLRFGVVLSLCLFAFAVFGSTAAAQEVVCRDVPYNERIVVVCTSGSGDGETSDSSSRTSTTTPVPSSGDDGDDDDADSTQSGDDDDDDDDPDSAQSADDEAEVDDEGRFVIDGRGGRGSRSAGADFGLEDLDGSSDEDDSAAANNADSDSDGVAVSDDSATEADSDTGSDPDPAEVDSSADGSSTEDNAPLAQIDDGQTSAEGDLADGGARVLRFVAGSIVLAAAGAVLFLAARRTRRSQPGSS